MSKLRVAFGIAAALVGTSPHLAAADQQAGITISTQGWDSTKVIDPSQQTRPETQVLECAHQAAIRVGMDVQTYGVRAPLLEIGDHKRGAPYISATGFFEDGTPYYVNAFLTRAGGVEVAASDFPITDLLKPFYRVNGTQGRLEPGFQQGNGKTSAPVRRVGEEFTSALGRCAKVLAQ